MRDRQLCVVSDARGVDAAGFAAVAAALGQGGQESIRLVQDHAQANMRLAQKFNPYLMFVARW